MIPENRKQALQIVLAAAQTRVDHRRSGSQQAMGPLVIGGNVNPDKVTETEIERSIALLKTPDDDFGLVIGPTPIAPSPADPSYDGPKVLFGRNCYGSNLPPVVGDGRWRPLTPDNPKRPKEGDARWHLPPRLYEPPMPAE